jgi:hypothetical protein
MLRTLRVGAVAAALARRASAALAAPAGTLTLSPRAFDGGSGLLQLDVGVSFAALGSRLLVALRCAP